MQEVINPDYQGCTYYIRSDNNDNKYLLTSFKMPDPTVTHPQ